MKSISPLRQKFIDHLTLRQLSGRTVETYIEWVADIARFHKRSPDTLGRPEIDAWLLHLIQQRKLSDSSVTLAINSLRSFYGSFLGRDLAVLFSGIRTPRRRLQMPRVFSPEEIERLVTVGTNGDPFARAFHASPALMACWGLRGVIVVPLTVILPERSRSAPNSARATSVRPAPTMPEMPRISPS